MKNTMKIGILFCGGCNCYFSREDFYEEILTKLGTKYNFSLYMADGSQAYDLIIVINGCQSECLLNTKYDCQVLLINNKNYLNGVNIIDEVVQNIETAKGK